MGSKNVCAKKKNGGPNIFCKNNNTDIKANCLLGRGSLKFVFSLKGDRKKSSITFLISTCPLQVNYDQSPMTRSVVGHDTSTGTMDK